MLTLERQQLIIQSLKEREMVTVQQLCQITKASESTIRRDLTELENKQMIKRVHGGASLLKKKKEEPTLLEKAVQFSKEKEQIAKYAASLIDDGDAIFLDAGTTTMHMIPYLEDKAIIVVTNGIPHVQLLMEYGVETYVLAGKAKQGTQALVGTKAVDALKEYQFDKCFLGMNGISIARGFTTPDPEEANVKKQAMNQAQTSYVLIDDTKVGEVTFAYVAPLDAAAIITSSGLSDEQLNIFRDKTTVKVVTE